MNPQKNRRLKYAFVADLYLVMRPYLLSLAYATRGCALHFARFWARHTVGRPMFFM